MTPFPVDSKNARSYSLRIGPGAVVLLLALGLGCWVGLRDESPVVPNNAGTKTEKKIAIRRENEISRSIVDSEDHAGTVGDAEIDGHRPTLQFRVKPEEPAPVMEVLSTGEQNARSRVRQMQAMRGTSFSEAEREAALVFLAGKELPEGMGRGSVDWLSDELLTALRLQQPPWDGLAAALADVVFQPETNPVTRDYIMQHLGHLWEQYSARDEIEKALWRAAVTASEMAPDSDNQSVTSTA